MGKVVIMGAGGKMGLRIVDNLTNYGDHKLLCVEVNKSGINKLQDRGLSVTPQKEAIPQADIIILAVPDDTLKKVTNEIITNVKSGAGIVLLDPAAAYAGVLPERDDITYFVTHPCHPQLLEDETDPKLEKDYFGDKRKMDIVCTLMHGSEDDYKYYEELCIKLWGGDNIRNSYRITLEEMAIIEPTLAETIGATLVYALKESYDKAVKKFDMPEEATLSFLMGHLRCEFGAIFGYDPDYQFSDAAELVAEHGKEIIFKPGWQDKILNKDFIRKDCKEITDKD